MSDTVKDSNYKIEQEDGDGFIQIADEVIASIVGLAVTEVEGVSKLGGGITRDIVAMLGINNVSTGVTVLFENKELRVDISVEIKYGFNILEVSKNIQEKVKQSLLTMTGIECKEINVRVSGIDFSE